MFEALVVNVSIYSPYMVTRRHFSIEVTTLVIVAIFTRYYNYSQKIIFIDMEYAILLLFFLYVCLHFMSLFINQINPLTAMSIYIYIYI